jgi:hypothetical protein
MDIERSVNFNICSNFICNCNGVRLPFCGTWPLKDPLSFPVMIQEGIWNSSGMILAGETKRTGEKPVPMPRGSP